MWYNGGMIADWIKEWAIPLSAGATFLLAIAAFWAIVETRDTAKKERKIRILDEIDDWAASIADCGSRHELPIDSKLNTAIVIDNLNKLTFLEYLRLSNRSEYIEDVANKLFGKEFI